MNNRYTFFDNQVSFKKVSSEKYPEAPFSPSEKFLDYSFDNFSRKKNDVYSCVRDILFQLELDKENYGKKDWNPFREIVGEGSLVMIKPAMTTDFNYSGDTSLAITPHASIIRPIIDYVLKAKPRKILIADGPIPNSDFKKVCQKMELDKLISFLNSVQDIPIELLDLRDEYSPKYNSGKLKGTFKLKGDPLGYRIIKYPSIEDSFLYPIIDDYKEFQSVSSVPGERLAPPKHYNKERIEYSIPKTVLECDTIINISKLKVHRKSGISCTIKNIVGITNKKYWLPHFRIKKDYSHYSNFNLFFKLIFILWEWIKVFGDIWIKGKKFREIEYPTVDGNWPGDDTVWRMVMDLYRMTIYLDKNGKFKESPQRKHFSLIDGIIGGEKFGPLAPSAKNSKVILGGINPIHTDYVATKIIGVKKECVRFIENCLEIKKFPLVNKKPEEVSFKSNLKINGINQNFKYPKQWKKCLAKRIK